MSYEKDQLENLTAAALTSASASAMIATALAPYATSASVSSAITTALAPYITSNSVSVAIAGVQSKIVLLGSVSISSALGSTVGFSGSWSDYYQLELVVSYNTNGTSNTASMAIYTDGGTTAMLNMNVSTVSNAAAHQIRAVVNLGGGYKAMQASKAVAGNIFFFSTATANSGFVNCIRLQHGTAASATLSTGVAQLIGYLR
jgi:hypothetical protein